LVAAFFFQAEDGIRDFHVTGVQTCALPISSLHRRLVEGQLLPLQTALQIRAEVDSVDAIREMVMNGAWATIMPISVFSKIHDREIGRASCREREQRSGVAGSLRDTDARNAH